MTKRTQYHELEKMPTGWWERTGLGEAMHRNLDKIDESTKGLSADGNALTISDIMVNGAAESLDGTFPGWSTAVATSAEGSDRMVSVAFDIAADTDSPANIQCQVEDSSGVMQTVAEWGVPPGVITTPLTVSGTFAVPRGRSYQFVRGAAVGVTETNTRYSYTELGV